MRRVIKEFTNILCGNKRVKSVNELRFFMLQSKYGRENETLNISGNFGYEGITTLY